MFTFLTDDPSSVYLVLGTIGLLFLVAFFVTGRVLYGVAIAIVVLLAAGAGLVDYLVVTDREQVELNTLAMREAAERGDIEAIGKHVSPEFNIDGLTRDELLSRARHYLRPQESRSRSARPRRIVFWNLKVKQADEGTGYIANCSAKTSGIDGFMDDYPVYLEFDFHQDNDGQWRMRKFRIFDAFGKEEIIRIPR